ncbi:MAG: type II toxin-antitoxin system HicA family toxin [Pseudonocardia sp.]|nr:type II toxin-antitoxin system HicA family toxin [Pseudonocardia sp.]
MPRAPRITSADLLRALHRAGWTTSRQSGSHVILVHPERAGARVVVPVHAGRSRLRSRHAHPKPWRRHSASRSTPGN